MTIVAAGDSFVFGSELNDCHKKTGSMSTFTALLSKGGDYENVAWPGFGNDSIARRVIERCERGGVTGVIVSWTFPGRYEFRFNYSTKQYMSPWYTITPWTSDTHISEIQSQFHTDNEKVLNDHISNINRAQETGVADFAKTFYSHVGSSEYWEVYSSLKEIIYLQNYLTLNQFPFLFTCADNSILFNSTVDRGDSVINSLVMQLNKENWFWFPAGTELYDTHEPRGFYQWAVENKYPIGTTHPLEQAHQDAANLMQGKFNELVKKSI